MNKSEGAITYTVYELFFSPSTRKVIWDSSLISGFPGDYCNQTRPEWTVLARDHKPIITLRPLDSGLCVSVRIL